MELSPSSTTLPASLDACEDREDDEWRPVPIRFTGLGQSGRQAGVRAAAGVPPLTPTSTRGRRRPERPLLLRALVREGGRQAGVAATWSWLWPLGLTTSALS